MSSKNGKGNKTISVDEVRAAQAAKQEAAPEPVQPVAAKPDVAALKARKGPAPYTLQTIDGGAGKYGTPPDASGNRRFLVNKREATVEGKKAVAWDVIDTASGETHEETSWMKSREWIINYYAGQPTVTAVSEELVERAG
jgi:hypothetical protein